MSRPTVIAWRKRHAAEGNAGPTDRPGRPAQIDEAAVVLATLEPVKLGEQLWASRLLALSPVRRMLARAGGPCADAAQRFQRRGAA